MLLRPLQTLLSRFPYPCPFKAKADRDTIQFILPSVPSHPPLNAPEDVLNAWFATVQSLVTSMVDSHRPLLQVVACGFDHF